MNATLLHATIAAVCPIQGLSIGNPTDKTTWTIQFDPSATTAQQQAGQSVLATFVDPVPVRQATGTQIVSAIHDLGLTTFFSQAATAAQPTKPIDAWYFNAITPNDFYPESNAKLGRISARAAAIAAAAVPPVSFTLATVFDKALTE